VRVHRGREGRWARRRRPDCQSTIHGLDPSLFLLRLDIPCWILDILSNEKPHAPVMGNEVGMMLVFRGRVTCGDGG
jgi:hypothetical protein